MSVLVINVVHAVIDQIIYMLGNERGLVFQKLGTHAIGDWMIYYNNE